MNLLGYTNIMPLIAPIDAGSNILTSPYVAMKGVNRIGFLVNFGVFTPAATTDFEVMTIEAATAEGGAEAAIAYNYRLSGAVTANTWGAITAVGATGAYINGVTGDGVSYWLEVDPDTLAASNYRYLRVKLTDDTNSTVCLVAVNAFIEPVYRQTTYVSATASASS
jgi:hypothetical protein